MESDDFQITILINLVEYKKEGRYGVSSKMVFNYPLFLLKNYVFSWSVWHRIRPRNPNRNLTINAQRPSTLQYVSYT